MARLDGALPPPPSATQLAVLELLLHGRSRREIQRALSISPSTVDHAIEAMMHRYGAETATILVARAWAERCAALAAELAACRVALAAIDRRGRGV